MPTRQDARRWSARLTRSIELRDGTELDTLADAANFILALPEHYQDRNSWKRATELLCRPLSRTAISKQRPSNSSGRYSLKPGT